MQVPLPIYPPRPSPPPRSLAPNLAYPPHPPPLSPPFSFGVSLGFYAPEQACHDPLATPEALARRCGDDGSAQRRASGVRVRPRRPYRGERMHASVRGRARSLARSCDRCDLLAVIDWSVARPVRSSLVRYRDRLVATRLFRSSGS